MVTTWSSLKNIFDIIIWTNTKYMAIRIEKTLYPKPGDDGVRKLKNPNLNPPEITVYFRTGALLEYDWVAIEYLDKLGRSQSTDSLKGGKINEHPIAQAYGIRSEIPKPPVRRR